MAAHTDGFFCGAGISTIIEPFRVKMVEPLRLGTPEERSRTLEGAHFNPFLLRAEDIAIDLLTDSGTGAMSAAQWAAMLQGDESYAGARSWYRFEEAVRELTGYAHVIPTHQGRAAERLLMRCMGVEGRIVPNNTHFDTTRANLEDLGATALDLPCSEAGDLESEAPFKGDMDVEALEALISREGAERIPFCMLTLTNNAAGGQPVSLANARAVRAVLRRHGIPLILDACRFAENAYLAREREEGLSGRTTEEVAREFFALGDGCTFSAKKDGLANIGGFLAVNDAGLARRARERLVLSEGFPTYGGLAGRDLEAVAVGLSEVLDEDYLRYRAASARYLHRSLARSGVPVASPAAMHAIYLDARRLAPHLPPSRLPGVAVSCALYATGGVRAAEIGTLMFGRRDPATGEELPAPRDLVRLCLPRRTYTQSHVDYVGEVAALVSSRADALPGLEITHQAERLRAFTARLRPLRS